MFIGHFALGFAAKRVTPKLSLAMLFVAAQLADLLWPVLVALGLVCSGFVKDRYAFAIVAALVVSHWLLDFLTHRPDMPLYPGGPEVGLVW